MSYAKHPKWETAFKISIWTFIATAIVAVIALFVNGFYPDEVFYNPEYVRHTGVYELMYAVKVIDTADFYATILSGIASGFTYLIKSLP